MQLRSGRTTLRRNSRNYEEFGERKKYQEAQKKIEETIYDIDIETSDENNRSTMLKNKWKTIERRTKHLLYLNKCQRKNNCNFTEKVQTIKEMYEILLYNMDYLIEMFNGEFKYKKNFPQAIYDKGNQLRAEMKEDKRTRTENEMANECNELINHVTQLIYRFILSN